MNFFNLTKEEIASKLKTQANNILLSNKIWGSVVGVIPGVDWALQKFVIKKNAVKKVGETFGIDIKMINDKVHENDMEIGIKNISGTGTYVSGGIVLSEGIVRTSSVVVETASIGLRIIGIGMAAAGSAIGVGLGGYLTYTYCEELLNKCEEIYKKKSNETNPYEMAVKYLSE